MSLRGRVFALFFGQILLVSQPSRADELPLGPSDRLSFRAGRLDADATLRSLTLRDRVEVLYGPYRLTSERLELQVGGERITFEGDARLALCPCPEPPVAFAWRGGWAEAKGDLFVRFPRVELFGVPVFALPFLWLRSPANPGLLPPVFAIRGADGLLAGSGVHLPFGTSALDLTGAAYLRGGAEIGATLTTEGTSFRLIADEIHGDRVTLNARGAFAPQDEAWIAWRASAIRGDRAQRGTVELADAAFPFDRAAVETGLAARAGGVFAIVTTGAEARAFRGEGRIAAGPTAGASAGGPLGALGAWSADADGVLLDDAGTALPLGRSALAAELHGRPGPLRLRVEAGGRALFAGDPASPSRDLALGLRAGASLPLVRDFGSLRHTIEPGFELAAAAVARTGSFFAPIVAASPPGLGLAAAGLTTSFGHGESAARLDLRAGASASGAGVSPLVRGRLIAGFPLAAASIEAALTGVGSALIGRARLGPEDGIALRAHIAGQTGPGAREARLLAGWQGAVPGGEAAYLAISGWSGGAGVTVPWTGSIRTSVCVADADLAGGRLLALGGAADYRHPCGCLGVGLAVAQRVGREGTDAAISVDLAPGPGFRSVFGPSAR